MVLHSCMQKAVITAFLVQIFISECQSQLSPGTCGIQPTSCPNSTYRSLDGSCNNVNNPVWGMPKTRYARLLPPNYANGTYYPTMAKSGKPLPPSRKVSVTVYPDVKIADPIFTLVAMQYGQIMAHDMSLTVENNQTTPESDLCCSSEGQLLEYAGDPEYCYPILVSKDDPVFSKLNISCFSFNRTGTDRQYGCGLPNHPDEQLSAVTHFLDLSIVYGHNKSQDNGLRLFKGGKLIFEERHNQEWLPRSNNVTGTCTVASPKEPCYRAGDVRVNQNPQLTLIQTVLLRFHNRIAEQLAEVNPRWDDERLFQEARKICIAVHQNIVYYEWLPIFLGYKNALKNGIIYKTSGYVDDYDPTVNPSVMNEHATAAFRYFHSSIAGSLRLITERRRCDGKLRLSDWWNRPGILEKDDNFDELTIGLTTQHQYAADRYHTREITDYWLRPINASVGQDLKAICVQRNRDHGLASYNELRKYCGLPKAKKFEDFLDVIEKRDVQKLKSLYESPDDVDLTVGCSLEKLAPGTLAGPTILCIITEQFRRTRVGDRFFFENSGETGFSLPQLREIRKTSVSKLFCDNTHVRAMQPRGFIKISEKNKIVPCDSLPALNLTLWKEV